MGRVVVIGSINVDLVVAADHLPQPGETVLGSAFARHFGGKGANQAVAAARAGASVIMLGAVGQDPDGDASLAALEAEGIDVSRVDHMAAPTGVAIIAVAPDGENQIVVAPGANAAVAHDDALFDDLVDETDGRPSVLLASLEVPMPTVVAAATRAARIGLRVVVNPAPAQPLPDVLLAAAPILTPNARELEAIAATSDLESGVAALLDRGAGAVVVTLGAAGALLAEGTRRKPVRGLQATVVDATGAGDAFAGVMAAWLADGRSLDDAVTAANAAAALSVTRAGAREGMPRRSTIEAALQG